MGVRYFPKLTQTQLLDQFETLQLCGTKTAAKTDEFKHPENARIPKKCPVCPPYPKYSSACQRWHHHFSKKCKAKHGKSLAWRHLQNHLESISCSDFFHRRELGSSWFLLGFFGTMAVDFWCPIAGPGGGGVGFQNPAAENNELWNYGSSYVLRKGLHLQSYPWDSNHH